MKKYQIFIDKNNELNLQQFNQQLHSILCSFSNNFHAIKYATCNDYSKPAKPLEIINSNHPKDAVISIWDNNTPTNELLEKLAQVSTRRQVYLLEETLVLTQQEKTGPVAGLCQIALLQKPEHLSHDEWLHNWQELHTPIAVETQSNFIYRQNICIDTQINGDWPTLDAVVEEIFPSESMTDRKTFFAAKNNDEKYKSNERRMIESCMRFIDFEKFDCLPMQEIVIKPLNPCT